jgi:hypothetical protein
MALPRWRKIGSFQGLSHETARLSTVLDGNCAASAVEMADLPL